MNNKTKGAVLLLLLGVLTIATIFIVKPMLFERKQRSTSDASQQSTEIRIGGDNYIGYWFTTSPDMRRQAARKGLSLQFTDDGANYAERLEKFSKEEYDCIVL